MLFRIHRGVKSLLKKFQISNFEHSSRITLLLLVRNISDNWSSPKIIFTFNRTWFTYSLLHSPILVSLLFSSSISRWTEGKWNFNAIMLQHMYPRFASRRDPVSSSDEPRRCCSCIVAARALARARTRQHTPWESNLSDTPRYPWRNKKNKMGIYTGEGRGDGWRDLRSIKVQVNLSTPVSSSHPYSTSLSQIRIHESGFHRSLTNLFFSRGEKVSFFFFFGFPTRRGIKREDSFSETRLVIFC